MNQVFGKDLMKCLENQFCKLLGRARSFDFFSRLSSQCAVAPDNPKMVERTLKLILPHPSHGQGHFSLSKPAPSPWPTLVLSPLGPEKTDSGPQKAMHSHF